MRTLTDEIGQRYRVNIDLTTKPSFELRDEHDLPGQYRGREVRVDRGASMKGGVG